MKANELIALLENHQLDSQLQNCICTDRVDQEIERYVHLIQQADERFHGEDYHLFSAPGRTEVGGNHTDHQQGRVLAASVNMDTACAVCACEDTIEFISEGFAIQPISIHDLTMKETEKNTSEALIRGILARFQELGYRIGGFKAYSNSTVLKGSGISSSACFETLIGTILSHLYNEAKISPVEIAKIGQYAENVFFGKPCGLMDQMACSVGGFVTIDFKDIANPKVEKVDFDFAHSGYSLCLVDTKGDHADLSDEYGFMPQEMKQVAQHLNKSVLSECSLAEMMENITEIRQHCSDRAILRSIHFFNETERVLEQVDALKRKDMHQFCELIIASGYSSYMYLQNVYSPSDIHHQNLSLALAISEQLLIGQGAYRVHGGGLAGTIQAFVPNALLPEYTKTMRNIYGEDACFVLSVRPVGGYKLI